MKKILCFLGFHNWQPLKSCWRICTICEKKDDYGW